jgi:hypothetical protein
MKTLHVYVGHEKEMPKESTEKESYKYNISPDRTLPIRKKDINPIL